MNDLPAVTPLAQPAAGTVIAPTTTIDTLFTTLFATRSSDLGAASYVWGIAPNSIVGTFPAATSVPGGVCVLYAVLQAKQVWPSQLAQ